MIDLVQLQNDVTLLLQSADGLANLNVVQYRKLRQQSELDLSAIYLSVRNGRSGCGILVEMPGFEAVDSNVPGPQGALTTSFVVLEEPNLNLAPATGTLIDAETAAQTILDQLHLQQIEGIGELYGGKNAMRPANEFPPGLIAYRVTLQLRESANQTTRVDLPAMSVAGLIITLANTAAFPNAAIYYTLDGTLPCPPSVNPGAQLYTQPFSLAGVPVLRWAAYQNGFNSSFIGQAVNQ